MHFTVPTKILSEVLTFVSTATPVRAVVPLTEHARIELHGSTLTVQATDFDIERRAVLDLTGPVVEGIALAPCRPLTKLLARIPGDFDIKIDASAGKLTVRAGRGHWSLPLLNDAFPVLDPPGPDAAKFRLSQAEALRVARRVTHSISDEEVRFYLNGVHLRQKVSGLFAVSTDSRRLTETRVAVESNGKVPGVIIPQTMIEALHAIAGHGDVEVVVDDRKIAFACGSWHTTSKLIDGTFPDYERLLPGPSDNQVIVDSSELLRTIARLQAVAVEDPAIVELRWCGERLEILLARQDGAGEELHATVSGAGRVALQSKYLTDAIRALDSDAVTIDQAAAGGPAILTSTEAGTLMLVMPIMWPAKSAAREETPERTARGK